MVQKASTHLIERPWSYFRDFMVVNKITNQRIFLSNFCIKKSQDLFNEFIQIQKISKLFKTINIRWSSLVSLRKHV
jgi:hypothetical protein